MNKKICSLIIIVVLLVCILFGCLLLIKVRTKNEIVVWNFSYDYYVFNPEKLDNKIVLEIENKCYETKTNLIYSKRDFYVYLLNINYKFDSFSLKTNLVGEEKSIIYFLLGK